ncbi:TolC family protein [Neisseria animalis]|uniref:TolC family protein n=2 Tax=Neisseria animalis TaxID=492 RepID=A0A5P3MPK2_NEIAN|nr:TolC family protein [Neisseria animalis]QEY23408.1 TolC family protein [Neisseria animalis]ROW33254.1 TolC family protein [Neisseria animalis]
MQIMQNFPFGFSKPILRPLLKSLAAASLVCAVQTAQAVELQTILQNSLRYDPVMTEAKANEESARSTTKATFAQHYPVLALTGTSVLTQHHKNPSNDRDDGIGVRGRVNVYSWGAIQASVERDKHKEAYFHHKFYETQEQLGQEIGKLYLEALRAKEMLRVLQQSLVRHNNLMKDLNVIVKYDKGRRSELIEAQSRQLQVETSIVQQRRAMEIALSRLSRYTGKKLSAADLQDPFASETAVSFIQRYRNADKGSNPSYQAQLAEQKSAGAELEASRRQRLPAINLEGSATRENRELFFNVEWNVLDIASRHNVQKNAHTLSAAEARTEQILKDNEEKSQTAEINMLQNEQREKVTAEHIQAQKDVVRVYEMQFRIARRTLTDVLGAYTSLSGIEQENIAARNDFRDAALEYLVTQSNVGSWAGIGEDGTEAN